MVFWADESNDNVWYVEKKLFYLINYAIMR